MSWCDPGDEAVSALAQFARAEDLEAAQVTAVGAFERAAIAWSRRTAGPGEWKRPHAVAVGRGVLAEPGSGHGALADNQSHRVVHDPDHCGWTSLDRELLLTRTKSSTNDPRFSQTERDVPGHETRSEVR